MIYWEKKGGKWEEGAQERERKGWNAIGESLCLLRYFHPFHELSILSPSVSVHPCFLSSPFSPLRFRWKFSPLCATFYLVVCFCPLLALFLVVSRSPLLLSPSLLHQGGCFFLISTPLFPFLLAPLSIILPQPVQFIDLVRQCSITAAQSNIWYS